MKYYLREIARQVGYKIKLEFNPSIETLINFCGAGWMIIESFHGAAFTSVFPAPEINALKIDVCKLIQNCYKNLHSMVNIFEF